MAAQNLMAKAIKRLLPKELPPSLSSRPGSLYQVLSRYPGDGVGRRVYQTRWVAKGIEGSFWEVTKVSLKDNGKHGKAWGRLVWRGKSVSSHPERIPGALKYAWKPASPAQLPKPSPS